MNRKQSSAIALTCLIASTNVVMATDLEETPVSRETAIKTASVVIAGYFTGESAHEVWSYKGSNEEGEPITWKEVVGVHQFVVNNVVDGGGVERGSVVRINIVGGEVDGVSTKQAVSLPKAQERVILGLFPDLAAKRRGKTGFVISHGYILKAPNEESLGTTLKWVKGVRARVEKGPVGEHEVQERRRLEGTATGSVSPKEKYHALLTQIRVEAGLTQEQLAKRLKKTTKYVADCETGSSSPSFIETRNFCRACGISLQEFSRRFEAVVVSDDGLILKPQPTEKTEGPKRGEVQGVNTEGENAPDSPTDEVEEVDEDAIEEAEGNRSEPRSRDPEN